MTNATNAMELARYFQNEYETRKKSKIGMSAEISVFVEAGDHYDEAKMLLYSYEPFRPGLRVHAFVRRLGTVYYANSSTEYPSIEEALVAISQQVGSRKVLLSTLYVHSPITVPTHHDWYLNSRSGFSAMFKVVENSQDDQIEPQVVRRTLVKEQLEVALKAGVATWNARPEGERIMVDWRDTDLCGLKLDGAEFAALDMTNSLFERASLQQANLNRSMLANAKFCDADLTGASLDNADASNANFSRVKFKGATLEKCVLRKCVMNNVDLTKAKLNGADLRGVDLSTATLSKDTKFRKALYDEETKFPSQFDQQAVLCWQGVGPDPQKLKAKQDVLSDVQVSDFGEFLERLKQEFDSERVKKAMAMLSKETFQLFSEVDNTMLLGVVKSQTDKDLVYACQLRADGVFSCCTQNLNACGGLRGALCKHLLVLTIGLARTKQIDNSKCLQWVLASRLEKKPKLVRERMTDVFLKYKGAEAGEVDWRPTETIPEDYYAF